MSTLGYKQIFEHNNYSPIIRTKILDLSTLCRYKNSKCTNKDRYYFDVTVNGSGLLNSYKHLCYFDSKTEAENAHKEMRLKLYDQETKPFLKKIASNHFLTVKDKEKIYQIIDRLTNLKKVEEVIVYK